MNIKDGYKVVLQVYDDKLDRFVSLRTYEGKANIRVRVSCQNMFETITQVLKEMTVK